MRLSKDFDLTEFVKSETGERMGIDNSPPDLVVEKLRRLCGELLQPLRDQYGDALTINSGYRCARLNKAVGGAAASQHTKGEAADVSCVDRMKLWDVLNRSGLSFDQAILYPTFVHLSYRNDRENRNQILRK